MAIKNEEPPVTPKRRAGGFRVRSMDQLKMRGEMAQKKVMVPSMVKMMTPQMVLQLSSLVKRRAWR